MTEYRKSTDRSHQVQLTSKVLHALWISRAVCAGERAPFEVWTHFVANGADIQVSVQDGKGKSLGKIKGQVFGNYFADAIEVPSKARESMTFTAKLPKHKLEKKSDACQVLPPARISRQKWHQKEVRRGDTVTLSADVENIPDGREVLLFVYEYDRDHAHDFVTRFPCRVEDQKISAEWRHQYHRDTMQIATDPEMQKHGKGYSAPTYFWVAEYGRKRFGDAQESGLLEFKDSIHLNLVDSSGQPVADEKYEIEFADGSRKEGRLDGNGEAQIKNIPPGKARIRYPDLSLD